MISTITVKFKKIANKFQFYNNLSKKYSWNFSFDWWETWLSSSKI